MTIINIVICVNITLLFVLAYRIWKVPPGNKSGLETRIHRLSQSLAGARTTEDFWIAVERASRDLGFRKVSLQIAGRVFEYSPPLPSGVECWYVRVPLSGSNFLYVALDFKSRTDSPAVDRFVLALREMAQSRVQGCAAADENSNENAAAFELKKA